VRFELHTQGTRVIGVYAGYIDTDMAADVKNAPKSSAAEVAARVIFGIEADAEDIFADKRSREVFDTLRKDDRDFDAKIQKLWDSRAKP
jgi:NAD(P)-dependent dehydrogenase (short-subunit alcohol dehydrogenase family)